MCGSATEPLLKMCKVLSLIPRTRKKKAKKKKNPLVLVFLFVYCV